MNPPWRGNIIPGGQELNKMKEMTGIVWDRENGCGRREASRQSSCLVRPLSLVEAGRLTGVAGGGRFPSEET